MNNRKICRNIVVGMVLMFSGLSIHAVPTAAVPEKKVPEVVKKVVEPPKAQPVAPVAPPVPVATPTAPPTIVTPTPTPVATAAPVVEPYEPKKLWGVPEYNTEKKLLYVKENGSQPVRNNCIWVKITGFEVKKPEKEIGRLRVAVWNSPTNYAKEGVKPFRASSHYAKDAVNNEMKFQLCGFDFSQKYSFFAHYDKKDTGKVSKVFGIPTDPYIFSNGLKRKGLGAPNFADTLITIKEGEEITLKF